MMDVLALRDRAQADGLRNRAEPADGWQPTRDDIERRTRPAIGPKCLQCRVNVLTIADRGVCGQCRKGG